jgi:hypothetical protein
MGAAAAIGRTTDEGSGGTTDFAGGVRPASVLGALRHRRRTAWKLR